METLTDDFDKPFNSIESADYLAESYYNEEVLIKTKDGLKKCKSIRCNARQSNCRYFYFFLEVK